MGVRQKTAYRKSLTARLTIHNYEKKEMSCRTVLRQAARGTRRRLPTGSRVDISVNNHDRHRDKPGFDLSASCADGALRLFPTRAHPIATSRVKICPCTGKVNCHCCGCGEDDEVGEDTSRSNGPQKNLRNDSYNDSSSNNSKSGSPELRCRCHGPDSLNLAGDLFTHLRAWGCERINPPLVCWLYDLEDSWSSPFLSLDPRPPRTLS